MRKKHRDIIVDGVRYGWIVSSFDEDLMKNGYSIYLNNQVIISHDEKHDDPWPITPKIIESEIRKWIKENI